MWFPDRVGHDTPRVDRETSDTGTQDRVWASIALVLTG